MSESMDLSPTNARRADVVYEIMKYLNDAGGPVHVQDVLQRVMQVLPPTPAESQIVNGRKKYDIFIRWASSGLSRVGWISKSGAQGIWQVTPVGAEALKSLINRHDLYTQMRKEARRESSEQSGSIGGAWGVVDGVVGRIPSGRWITFTDLEAVTGKSAGTTGVHMWNDKPTGWYRVLRVGGVLSAVAYGEEARAAEQRELLDREGITLDPRAPEHLKLGESEIREIALNVKSPPRAWLVRSAVRGFDILPTWLSEGFVSLPASQLTGLTSEMSDDEIHGAVDSGYENLGYSQKETKFKELRAFLKRMRPGNLVLAIGGDRISVGVITSDAKWHDSDDERSNIRRDVDWDGAGDSLAIEDLPESLKGRMRVTEDVVDLSDLYSLIDEMRGGGDWLAEESSASSLTPIHLGPLDSKIVEKLLIGDAWLNEFVQLLNDRRQVILYGPPGTGKTFLAQEVAEALGGKERVTLVQFHPSYAYEDFFEGYRPAGSTSGGVSLQLVPGPFRKVVDAARANPSEPFFLIVDEINRANLAKVFGELYFLLEYRERSIDLLYSSGDSGSSFSLPDNVYLIGTMNTADRSIALVDAAMRRRFGFLSLHPEDEKLDEVLRAWLRLRELPLDRADLLVELNRRINDKDFKLGPSYLMTLSVGTEEGLERIWRSSIIPLLEEYHAGDGIDARRRYGLASLRTSLAVVPEPETDMSE